MGIFSDKKKVSALKIIQVMDQNLCDFLVKDMEIEDTNSLELQNIVNTRWPEMVPYMTPLLSIAAYQARYLNTVIADVKTMWDEGLISDKEYIMAVYRNAHDAVLTVEKIME